MLPFDFIFQTVFTLKVSGSFWIIIIYKNPFRSLPGPQTHYFHYIHFRHHSFKRKNVDLRSVIVFSEVAGMSFCKCLPCVCLPGPGCRHYTSSGQAVVSGLPMHRFRLRCGVPPSCVCQRQFGLIYRPLTHSTLDPTSAAGMAIPCVGGGSTWVVLH